MRCTVKTMMKTILLTAFAGFSAALCAADRVEDAYDLYNPTPVQHDAIGIWIEGDGGHDRVSLKQGKNPLVVKDANGKLMEEDPNFVTEYVKLSNHGAEDNRAFRLHGSRGVSKDKWKRLVFSFVPRRDGKVRIHFGRDGGWRHDYSTNPATPARYGNIHYTYYAKATIKNAVLKDPNFTSARMWNSASFKSPFRSIKAESMTEKGAPAAKIFKSIDHMRQDITVKKDKEVVVSFYVRSGDFFECKLWKEEED